MTTIFIRTITWYNNCHYNLRMVLIVLPGFNLCFNLFFLAMKHNHIHATSTILTIIVASLIFMCQNSIAQSGYTPWLRIPPSRSVIVPYPPTQSYRQAYNPNIQTDGVLPFISFSIHFDPLISWFSTDSYDTRNDGVVPGYNFGISYNRYFSPNYSFYSGLDIIKAGGRLINRETSNFELKDYNGSILTVKSGDPITVSYTHLRAHETVLDLVCRLLLE